MLQNSPNTKCQGPKGRRWLGQSMLLLVCTGKSSLRLCLNWVRFWQLKETARAKQEGGYKSCCIFKGQVPCGTFERAAEVGTKVKAKAF